VIPFGTVKPGTTLQIPFESFAASSGAPITITGLATSDIQIYKDGSTTQRASASGFTLLDTDGIDFDSVTGLHGFSIDLADNTTAGFYAAGSKYWVVVSTVTVDSQTMSFIAATFEIGYPDALLNTTIASLSSQTSFTLTNGPAEDDALNGMWVIIHDVASSVQLGWAIVADYTGSTKTVTLAAATTFTAAASDNISVMMPSPLQPSVMGRLLSVGTDNTAQADIAKISGDSTSADNLELYTDGTTPMPVNAIQISGDSTAADNLEAAFDGTGYSALIQAISRSQWGYGTIYYAKASGGNDSNDGLSPATAKLTLTGARTAASAGDLIFAQGTFDESFALKNGVDLYFPPGSGISRTSGDPCLKDNAVALTCRILGRGLFLNNQDGGQGLALSAASTVHLDCDEIYASGTDGTSSIITSNTSSRLTCRARGRLRADGYDSIVIAGYADIEASLIECGLSDADSNALEVAGSSQVYIKAGVIKSALGPTVIAVTGFTGSLVIDGGLIQNSGGGAGLEVQDGTVFAEGVGFSTGAGNHVTQTGGTVILAGCADDPSKISGTVTRDPGAVRSLLALPNAAAAASGGLYTRGTGAGQINQAANGQIDVNIVAISGDSTSADNLESYTDGTTPAPVNVTQISGDSTAADNLEATFDGTGYTNGNAPATQTAIAAVKAKTDLLLITSTLRLAYTTGLTLYAVVWNTDGDIYRPALSVFSSFSAGNWTNYATAVTFAETGTTGDYLATFVASLLSGGIGNHIVDVRVRIGGSAATTDPVIGMFEAHIDSGVLVSIKALDATLPRMSTAGAGLTDLGGMSTTMKAQVESEALDALNNYDPPTNIEMIARTLDSADYATAASIAALNDLSAAQVNTEVDTALADYGALKPTTLGRTLDVTATGEAGIDWSNIGAPTTVQNLSGTTIKTATDVETDTQDIQSKLPAALVDGRIDANVGAISADSVAADNAEAFFDGTGYAGTNNTIPTVTSVTGIAAGGITAASIATGAIDADSLATDAVAEIADGVWDEVASGHTTTGTFGQALYIIRSGTAQAGAAGSITLDASASGTDDFYNNTLCILTDGTGAGQSRFIEDYTGSTKVGTVSPNWVTTPDNTSVFVIVPFDTLPGSSVPTVADIVDAVWDESQSGHTTAGTFGRYLDAQVANVETDTQDIQSRLPAALVGGKIDANVGSISGDTTAADNLESYTDGTTPAPVNVTQISGDSVAADNAESFFDGTGYAGTNNVIPTVSSVTAVATGGITAASIATGAIDADALATDAVAEIADGVWDEAIAGHLTGGSTGNALNSAGSAGDPWSTALPGVYGSGTAGKILGDNLDATVSSRATQTSVDTIDDIIDTEIPAIKAKTDNLPSSPAAVGSAMTLTSGERNSIATAILDLTDGVETGETVRQFFRLVRAVLVEKDDVTVELDDSGTVVFKRKDGSTTALTVEFNATGERTSSTVGTV
jgi:hypothetical protein